MIAPASEKLAEQNRDGFQAGLRTLTARRGGGIEYYQVRGSSIVEYDPVENCFFHHIELHGYRPHSLGAKKPLTSEEEDALWHEVSLGLVELWIMPCTIGEPKRFWKGVSNMMHTQSGQFRSDRPNWEEVEKQSPEIEKLIHDAAEASDLYGDDECERYAEELRRKS